MTIEQVRMQRVGTILFSIFNMIQRRENKGKLLSHEKACARINNCKFRILSGSTINDACRVYGVLTQVDYLTFIVRV